MAGVPNLAVTTSGHPSGEAGGRSMTALRIPCCLCGAMILPNAANQCGACLAQQFDLKSILQRGPGGAPEITIHQCRRCRRYERSENSKLYEECDPESPELLSLCLKRIPALHAKPGGGSDHHAQMQNVQRIHLVDAIWVWTEPHSMRLRVRLTVRADVNESPRTVTIQQRVLVELVVKFKMCGDCNREFTNRTWHAVVQLRQKRNDDAPRKGLILVEMALAKNADVRKHVISMDTTRHGFDFYFLSLMHAQMFASYLAKIAPMRIKTTKKLVSTDVKNNTANMKYTVACDMVPLCRDDLVIADKRGSKEGAGAGRLSGRLCLVTKMSSSVHFVDASPARSAVPDRAFADLHPEKYWKGGGEKSYRVLSSSRRMVRFVVLDVELCVEDGGGGRGGDDGRTLYEGPQSGAEKYALADVEVAREVDLGHNDETFRCVTHLGNLLQVGDVVLGYDLTSSVLSGAAEWSVENAFNSSFVMPDIVLVKKVKGGGGGGGTDGREGDESEQKSTVRAKSSGSKKRERRRRKEEKKARALEEAAARMGFIEDDVGEGNEADDGALDEERAAFERELQNDPELARELDMAEQELARGKETVEVDNNGQRKGGDMADEGLRHSSDGGDDNTHSQRLDPTSTNEPRPTDSTGGEIATGGAAQDAGQI